MVSGGSPRWITTTAAQAARRRPAIMRINGTGLISDFKGE